MDPCPTVRCTLRALEAVTSATNGIVDVQHLTKTGGASHTLYTELETKLKKQNEEELAEERKLRHMQTGKLSEFGNTNFLENLQGRSSTLCRRGLLYNCFQGPVCCSNL